jgi:plastocyanin
MKVFAIVVLCLFATAAFGATVNVAVGPGFTFSPNPVNINVGDTVQWNWAGATHSSTSNATTGVDAWDSALKSSGSFTHTFNNAGDFPYYCSLHSFPGGTAMNGIVHVAAPVTTAVPALSPRVLLILLIALAIIGATAITR